MTDEEAQMRQALERCVYQKWMLEEKTDHTQEQKLQEEKDASTRCHFPLPYIKGLSISYAAPFEATELVHI